MPGVQTVLELLRALWQELRVAPILQRALCCGSLAQVAGAARLVFFLGGVSLELA